MTIILQQIGQPGKMDRVLATQPSLSYEKIENLKKPVTRRLNQLSGTSLNQSPNLQNFQVKELTSVFPKT